MNFRELRINDDLVTRGKSLASLGSFIKKRNNSFYSYYEVFINKSQDYEEARA